MNEKKELISVVVPVYKVEKYVSKCIESILNQTYPYFELILIDDGSPDESGNICDMYAKKDNRIRVIHQKNKGLAEVRNIGIREANGIYLQFVDSDDWIEKDTLRKCLSVLHENDADIVCFRAVISFLDGREKPINKEKYGIKVLSKEEALSTVFFTKYVDVISCNKFIKLNILKEIHYPCGKLYEDMYTTYKIIDKADRIACISDELYHYLRNPESIGHNAFSDTTYDLGRAAEECYEYCSNIQGTDKTLLLVGMWFWKIAVANKMIRAETIDSEYIKGLRRSINLFSVFLCDLLSPVQKIQMYIFKSNFFLYSELFKLYKKLS